MNIIPRDTRHSPKPLCPEPQKPTVIPTLEHYSAQFAVCKLVFAHLINTNLFKEMHHVHITLTEILKVPKLDFDTRYLYKTDVSQTTLLYW